MKGPFSVKLPTTHDWKTPEYGRTNRLDDVMCLSRITSGTKRCRGPMDTAEPDVMIRDASRVLEEEKRTEATSEATQATISVI